MIGGSLALALWAATSASTSISGPYTLIPIEPGVNRIAGFAPGGADATIVSAWFSNGNAWGHRQYQVLIPNEEGDWYIVAVAPDNRGYFVEVPHAAADAISVVRFAWGLEDGRRVALALTAVRSPERSVPEPAKTTITVYAMRRNSEVGTTPTYFAPLREWVARRPYCHAEMALHVELGLALSADYSGPHSPGGC